MSAQDGSIHPVSVLKEDLAKVVNDKSRKIHIRGKHAIVPLKFDEDGNPATIDRLIFKRLSLTDLRFLKVLRENNWDVEKSASDVGLQYDNAVRLVKKLACFREEEAKVKALCEIPTPSWIKAKHVENFYEGGSLEDSQHKSLQELAKIEGAYKNTSSVNVNVVHSLQLPTLSQEQEAQLRQLGDSIATTVEEAA